MTKPCVDTFLRPKSVFQHAYDFMGAPLRMIVLPDETSQKMGFTCLLDERLRAVLPHIEGKLLDIGAGDNLLVKVYGNGVGVDVHDFGGGAMIVEDTNALPFEDESFGTITFLACLNHIPDRQNVLREAHRLLRPGGRLIATMISPFLGKIGHAIWWYSEEKHREVAPGEQPGLSSKEMRQLIQTAGFSDIKETGFVYRLNRLFLARKPASSNANPQ